MAAPASPRRPSPSDLDRLAMALAKLLAESWRRQHARESLTPQPREVPRQHSS